MGEDGWKERYYAEKFDAETEDDRERIRKNAVRQLTVILFYFMYLIPYFCFCFKCLNSSFFLLIKLIHFLGIYLTVRVLTEDSSPGLKVVNCWCTNKILLESLIFKCCAKCTGFEICRRNLLGHALLLCRSMLLAMVCVAFSFLLLVCASSTTNGYSVCSDKFFMCYPTKWDCVQFMISTLRL